MKRVWLAKKFSYIFEASPSSNSAFFMQALFSHAIGHMGSSTSLSQRLGGLYSLYCLYETQPYKPRVKIYLCLGDLKRLKMLVIDAKENGIRTIRFIVKRMLTENMFLFGSSDTRGPHAQRIEAATKLQDRTIQIAYKKLLSNTEIEDYVHMNLGKELGLETFKKMSIEYANAKEKAFKVIPDNTFNKIEECIEMGEFVDPEPELFDSDYKSIDEMKKILKTDGNGLKNSREEVEKAALLLLAARAMTAMELRKKLRGKKYPSNIVDVVVAGFKSRGLLDDRTYAESFTRSKWLSSTWGPRRIEHVLVQKGVSRAETEEARKHVFEEDDGIDSDCHNLQHGMSKVSLNRLYVQASKQWRRNRNAIIDNRRAAIVRWLRYRGFDWGVTNHILKKLESQCSA